WRWGVAGRPRLPFTGGGGGFARRGPAPGPAARVRARASARLSVTPGGPKRRSGGFRAAPGPPAPPPPRSPPPAPVPARAGSRLAVFGRLAAFLPQNAIHAGPLVASQSTVVLIDPLASICIGIGLFGDDLQTGGAAGPLEALSLLIAFGGAFWLARSPVIAAM